MSQSQRTGVISLLFEKNDPLQRSPTTKQLPPNNFIKYRYKDYSSCIIAKNKKYTSKHNSYIPERSCKTWIYLIQYQINPIHNSMWTTSDNRVWGQHFWPRKRLALRYVFSVYITQEPNRDVKHRASTSKCYNNC